MHVKYTICLLLIEWQWPGFQKGSSFLRRERSPAVFGLFSLCGERVEAGERNAELNLKVGLVILLLSPYLCP